MVKVTFEEPNGELVLPSCVSEGQKPTRPLYKLVHVIESYIFHNSPVILASVKVLSGELIFFSSLGVIFII